MKRAFLMAFFALSASLGAQSASAEWGDTYQATCKRIEMRGPYLSALCLDMYQRFRYTQLDLRACGAGGVSNRLGELACNNPFGAMQAHPRERNPDPRFEWRYDRRARDFHDFHDDDDDFYHHRDRGYWR